MLRKIADFIAFALAVAGIALLVLWGFSMDGNAQAGETRRVRILGEHTAFDRQQVATALEDWNQALRGELRFVIVDSGDAEVALTIVYRPNATVADEAAGRAVQAGKPGSGLVLARVGNVERPCNLAAIVRHEIGHLFGLPHVEGGTMAARCGPGAARIDAATAAAALARLRRME